MWNSRSIAAILEMLQYVAYLKMLFKLLVLLNSVHSLTILTFCVQWMCLAALLLYKHNVATLRELQGIDEQRAVTTRIESTWIVAPKSDVFCEIHACTNGLL